MSNQTQLTDDEMFRESVFAWLRTRMLTAEGLSRDQLSEFELHGKRHRFVGTQTGIWRVKEHSPAAVRNAKPQFLE